MRSETDTEGLAFPCQLTITLSISWTLFGHSKWRTAPSLLGRHLPKFHSCHVSTRHDTFDVSSPCILSVSSLSNSSARHARHDELDWLDTSNVSCRDVTWRAKWNFGYSQLSVKVCNRY